MLKIATSPYLIAFVILLGIVMFSLFPLNENHATTFHSPSELAFLKTQIQESILDMDTVPIFGTASLCSGCHGLDPLGNASVNEEGADVNVYDDWNSSMMANSAKDPFWRAKVSHEILINPMHSEEIQDKCTSCHAPMGNYNARYHDQGPYTMDMLVQDTFGLEGVSCAACHQRDSVGLDLTFSGEMRFDTNRVIYGPYEIPFGAPMENFVGYEPVYHPHINDAGVCASCHTLITNTVDLEGEYTGGTFVEQATYHEWLNSDFNANNVTCQECHFPRIDDGIVLSANYAFLGPRSPYGLHEMAGANTFMLQLMKANKEALGIEATNQNYDQSINATFKMLTQRSIDIAL